MGFTAAVDTGQHLEEVMTCTLPMGQMQIQIAAAIWAILIIVQPMQILHSLLVKEIFVSMKWKYLCLKPTKISTMYSKSDE